MGALTESRGGIYASNIVETGSPKATLEIGAVLGTCCTEVAVGFVASEHPNACDVAAWDPLDCPKVKLEESFDCTIIS